MKNTDNIFLHVQDDFFSRGRLAQSGKHLPTNSAIQVRFSRREGSLRPWQKKAQP